MKRSISILLIALQAVFVSAISKENNNEQLVYGDTATVSGLSLTFVKGKEHNHPLYAIWLADGEGKYLQTLYVSQSIGKGEFKRINRQGGVWAPGKIQRPAALPYWGHQRNIVNESGNYLPTPENPLPDAITGATPAASFTMKLHCDLEPGKGYQVFLEVNQTWDWNEFWTNDLYPEDKEYKTSCQPALIYSASVNSSNKGNRTEMKAVGHSHPSGKDGSLNPDLSTITTALKIADKIYVKVL